MITWKQEAHHIVIKFFGIKIKWKHDPSHLYPYKKRNPRIKSYKFVHVMNNGIHSVYVIKFINKYFNKLNEHCFLFPCHISDKIKNQLINEKHIFSTHIKNIKYKTTSKIIIHGLFDNNTIKSFYKNKKYLDKTYWFIWGGDLYHSIDSYRANYVYKNVAGIISCFDKEVYEEKFGLCKSYYDVTYPHQISHEMINFEKTKHDYIHIQINNSADETTLEMLEKLSKFKEENIKITTILSYNSVGHKDVRLQIMKKGYDLFGLKFNPIIEFIPADEYANHLASVDIYISNQNRQQGNGNASFICSLGKKVFIKSDTPVYKKYNSLGICYYDTYDIDHMNFDQFCHLDKEITKQSVRILKARMCDDEKVRQWKNFFESQI